MPCTIRQATDQDQAVISAVMAAAFVAVRQVYRPTASAISRARSVPYNWLVAADQGAIAGALKYRQEHDRLHLGIGVVPEHQRTGAGRALIEALAELAAAKHLRAISLYTVRETGNVPIFERLGFTAVRTEPAEGIESMTGAALTDVYMERLVYRPDQV